MSAEGPGRDAPQHEASEVMPHVLGVIDLARGQAVHAVGGHRARYVPLKLAGAAEGDSLALAQRYLDCGVGGLYVADLDALGGREVQREKIGALAALGLPMWLDAGLSERSSAVAVVDALSVGREAIRWVIATETLRDLGALASMVEALGPDRVIAGLDLRDGRVVARTPALTEVDPVTAAARLAAAGASQCLVLDVAIVGTGAGPVLAETVAAIRTTVPALRLATGGGVRSAADVRRLLEAGSDAVLVGTALHGDRSGWS